jgi:hypothetical protein
MTTPRLKGFLTPEMYTFSELIGPRIQNEGETIFAGGLATVDVQPATEISKTSITVTARGSFDLPEGVFESLRVRYSYGVPGVSLIEGLQKNNLPAQLHDKTSQKRALQYIVRIITERNP